MSLCATLRHSPPSHATSLLAIPCLTNPRHSTPHDSAPFHATPLGTIPRHITPRYATPSAPFQSSLIHAMPPHVTPRLAAPHHRFTPHQQMLLNVFVLLRTQTSVSAIACIYTRVSARAFLFSRRARMNKSEVATDLKSMTVPS